MTVDEVLRPEDVLAIHALYAAVDAELDAVAPAGPLVRCWSSMPALSVHRDVVLSRGHRLVVEVDTGDAPRIARVERFDDVLVREGTGWRFGERRTSVER